MLDGTWCRLSCCIFLQETPRQRLLWIWGVCGVSFRYVPGPKSLQNDFVVREPLTINLRTIDQLIFQSHFSASRTVTVDVPTRHCHEVTFTIKLSVRFTSAKREQKHTFVEELEDASVASVVALVWVRVELEDERAAGRVVLLLDHGDVAAQLVAPRDALVHLGPLQVEEKLQVICTSAIRNTSSRLHGEHPALSSWVFETVWLSRGSAVTQTSLFAFESWCSPQLLDACREKNKLSGQQRKLRCIWKMFAQAWSDQSAHPDYPLD